MKNILYRTLSIRTTLIAIAVVVLAFFITASSVHAAGPKRFFSSDAFRMNWAVDLVKNIHSIGESVVFDFSFLDSELGLKPAGSTVRARVNGVGNYSQIVGPDSSGMNVPVSLPSSGGSAPSFIEFLSVTGGWFDTSGFDAARFGEKQYVFSVSLSDNDPPFAPTISGANSCELGEVTTFSITSDDPQGDNIYYYAYLYGEGLPTRLPPSGFVPSGTTQTFSRTIETDGVYSLYARAVDESGESSTWTTVTVPCGDVCTHCVYDGGDPSVALRAVPSIVRQGSTAEIVWTLENVYNCSVSGSNGDAWDWATIRAQQSMTTSFIDESVTYTINCEDEGGSPISDTATVYIVPTWQER